MAASAGLTRVGVTCALCHSTVDNSFAPGIGKRQDGWPNRDLNPGAIIALSPALDAKTKLVYNSWGPGKYDPRFNQDAFNGPQVIPPAYGLEGMHRITSTGDGDDIAYWNRYVGVTQLGGHGTFSDRRTGVNVTNGSDDLVTSKLPALQAYQLTLVAPSPPHGSFDPAAAARGQALFSGKGTCATCHTGAEFTDANARLLRPTSSASRNRTERRAMRREALPGSIGQRRCAVFGSTRLTSTTAAPRRSRRSSRSTTCANRSACRTGRSRISRSISSRCSNPCCR